MSLEENGALAQWVASALVAIATGGLGVGGGLLLGRQKRRHERETRFEERRVEAVTAVWAALEKAHRNILLPADVQGWAPENQRIFDDSANAFRETFNQNRLYFRPELDAKLEEYWGKMKDAGWATRSRVDQMQQIDWYERYTTAHDAMNALKAELSKACRKALGDPDEK